MVEETPPPPPPAKTDLVTKIRIAIKPIQRGYTEKNHWWTALLMASFYLIYEILKNQRTGHYLNQLIAISEPLYYVTVIVFPSCIAAFFIVWWRTCKNTQTRLKKKVVKDVWEEVKPPAKGKVTGPQATKQQIEDILEEMMGGGML